MNGSRLGRLHLITDSGPGSSPAGVVRQVRELLTAPADDCRDLVLQFRPADGWTDRDCYRTATELVALGRPLGVPVLVNDRLDVAVASGAAGGHVGADDLPVAAARKVLGSGLILGGTARDATGVAAALTAGADYVGVGPCFHTASKAGLPPPLGAAAIAAIAHDCPNAAIIAIGGVTSVRVPELLASGAYGVAVIGAVWLADDPSIALNELLAAVAAGNDVASATVPL